MKEEESKILSKLGKEPGFKTPENYFSDFQNNIAEKLPNFSVSEEKVKPNLWVRFRPYVYMAAMFADIFCMIQVFDVLNGTSGENAIANGKVEGTELIEDASPKSDTMLNYHDSVESNSPSIDIIDSK